MCQKTCLTLFMKVILIPAKPKKSETEKLRVAAYCRVSTRQPEQISSLESQIYYYERKIKGNKNWLYRGVYYDIGSGLRREQRTGLAKLLKQAEKGRIDLILVKSISRLARNTVDVLEATRMLKDKGVDIVFENENLKLSEQYTELLLSIRSAVAQEESRNISNSIKWGYKRKFERGEIQTKYKNFMGYTEKNGEITIVPEEAEIVRTIFGMYAAGSSIRQICRHLEENGIKTKTGKAKWAPNVISKMLHNEKYKGCTLMQKTYSDDLLTGKRKKNNGEVKQYYYEDTHPAIVSKELFEKVQLLLNAR